MAPDKRLTRSERAKLNARRAAAMAEANTKKSRARNDGASKTPRSRQHVGVSNAIETLTLDGMLRPPRSGKRQAHTLPDWEKGLVHRCVEQALGPDQDMLPPTQIAHQSDEAVAVGQSLVTADTGAKGAAAADSTEEMAVEAKKAVVEAGKAAAEAKKAATAEKRKLAAAERKAAAAMCKKKTAEMAVEGVARTARDDGVTMKLNFGRDDEDSNAEEVEPRDDSESGDQQSVVLDAAADVSECASRLMGEVCTSTSAETTSNDREGAGIGADAEEDDPSNSNVGADVDPGPADIEFNCLDSDEEDGADGESEFLSLSGELQLGNGSVSEASGEEGDEDEERCNYDDELYSLSQDRAAVHAMKTTGWNYDIQPDSEYSNEYPGLYQGPSGPSPAVASKADSPIDLFFFFLPRSLWRNVAVESNRYFSQSVPKKASRIQDKQKALRRKDPSYLVERKADIRARLYQADPVQPRELIVVLGLMVARMLCPHKRRLAYHWSATSSGAIPKGTFGRFLARNRFDEILATLHFSNNQDLRAKGDRAWKIRPVVSCLQRTFKRGYVCPAVLSFDEGMLPTCSPYNGTRVFMKDKPHRWGTKLFLTCDADTAYCLRLEVYCGVKQHLGQGPQKIDAKSGPSAVLRNLEYVVLKTRSEHHVVAIDRYYSSVPLALELLAKKVYVVGTVQTTRIGYAEGVIDKAKKHPKTVERGTFKLAKSKIAPSMVALSWMDSKPVHFLSTGASTKLLSVDRRLNATERVKVPAPKLVKDYHQWMGGVDVHDQLRLQRYSLQLSFVFKKYYKSLFLGLVDMALVNAYIVHKTQMQKKGEPVMTRDDFFAVLQDQLLLVTDEDMEADEADAMPPTPTRGTSRAPQTDGDGEHAPAECPDFMVLADGSRRRYQRACKVWLW